MCYSTTLRKEERDVTKRFRAKMAVELEFSPYHHLNGFTHGNLYIVPMDNPDEILPAMWGLVPPFGMNDPAAFYKKYNTLNAKSETVFTSNTFKHSIHDKRCLIIADGFHEPHHVNKVSYPYFCHYKDDSLFAFAGLYTELDDELFSCTIITMPANEQFEQIHNQKKRQPLVLDEHWEDDWLLPDLHEPGIKELMKSAFTTKQIEAYPVSRDLYKRGLKLYRELNEGIYSDSYNSDRSGKYKPLIASIDNDVKSFDGIEKTTNVENFTDVLGTLGIEPYSIYKDIVSAKTKKVEGLVAQLKELKLQPLEKKEKKSE